MTHEYVKAAEEFHLSYSDLKQMARNSLEYSFLPGESLWVDHAFGHSHAACSTYLRMQHQPEGECKAYLARSPKATQQWELEQRFVALENQHGTPDLGRSPAAR